MRMAACGLCRAGGAAGVLTVSQAKLAKRKHTASRLRSTTTMTTSVCATLGCGPLCVIVDDWNAKRQAFC